MRFIFIIILIILLNTTSDSRNIEKTKHNLSLNSNLNSICLNCHNPHNINKKDPAWIKDPNRIFLQNIFTSSGKINKNLNSLSISSDSISLFCLSCHDGGNLDREIKTLDNLDINSKNKINRAHPINFKTKDISEERNHDNSPKVIIDFKRFPLYNVTETLEGIEGYVECPSCHSVHDNLNPPFLRETMTESRLCLGCHNK